MQAVSDYRLSCTYKDSVCRSMSDPLLVKRFIRVRLLLSFGSSKPLHILDDLCTNLRFIGEKLSSRLSCSVSSHILCTKKINYINVIRRILWIRFKYLNIDSKIVRTKLKITSYTL
jgi:hypothetical protein